MQLGVAERNPQTGEDCESIKNPEGYVGPLFSTSDLHSVPAGLCNWYWRTQGMFSLNLGLVTSRNDRSTPRDSVLPSTGLAFSSASSRCLPLWFFCVRSRRSRRSELASALSLCRLGTTAKPSRNECVFTPAAADVNNFFATLSPVFSIECSSSTERCRIFVQPRKPRLTRYLLGR